MKGMKSMEPWTQKHLKINTHWFYSRPQENAAISIKTAFCSIYYIHRHSINEEYINIHMQIEARTSKERTQNLRTHRACHFVKRWWQLLGHHKEQIARVLSSEAQSFALKTSLDGLLYSQSFSFQPSPSPSLTYLQILWKIPTTQTLAAGTILCAQGTQTVISTIG